MFDDPFFGLAQGGSCPAVDIAEEGNAYIIEAELPGVCMEDVTVKIGENSRSATIQGKMVRCARQPEQLVVEMSANGRFKKVKPP